MRHRSHRVHRTVRLALVVLVTLGVGACASETGAPVATSTSTVRASAAPSTTARTPRGTVAVSGRARLEGFEEVTVTVVDAAGVTRTFCLMLADTEELREQGLMFVTDPALGGYDGMVFAFTEDTDGAFWMKNTRLPLSIAYVRADGTTTSTTDMQPCPDAATTCPVYPSGGSYRTAIEVPQGRLAALGISDRSRVTIGAKGCAAAGTSAAD